MGINNVCLIGRVASDVTCKYGAESQSAFCRFSVAIDRGKDRNGENMGADFPNVVCFGKTAENCERFLKKGLLVGIQGRIRTGKYEGKDGKTVFTTDVYADRVEFLEWSDKPTDKKEEKQMEMPSGFSQITDEDIPF